MRASASGARDGAVEGAADVGGDELDPDGAEEAAQHLS